jgi:hypothetical protein
MIRTPKEWDETCWQCKGSGIVHKREIFALWTPEEHAALMPAKYATIKLDPAKHRGVGAVPTNAVICSAHAGASIFEACKEAVTLARAFGRPVAFEFNEAVAVCHADSDPITVAKTWWKLAYGKTYEEAMADR